MKQLKFMLAAATAISLATAAQAGATDKTLFNEDFDDYTADQVVTEITGFSFEGTEGDNESAIIKQAEGDMALNVNTGTDPLLRALDYNNNTGAQDLDFADETAAINYVTIDTTVEFTVTPVGDTVTATGDDKLMIFLREVAAAEEGGASTTKLQVKALQYRAAYEGWNEETESLEKVDAVMIAKDWDVVYVDGSEVVVEANKPYNLSVKTELIDGVPMFKISLGGKEIKPVENLHLAASNSSYFPSLLGPAEKTLTSVGFAGEGTVDDLVVTKNYNVPDAVDFTFALELGDGVSAVQWTIGGVEQTGNSGTVQKDQLIKIVKVTYVDWYGPTGDYVDGWEVAYSEALGTGIKVEAKPTANVTTDAEGNVKIEVTENTKPADVGITTGSFAADTTPVAELNKALTWATTKGGATSASAAGTLVGDLDFSNDTETTTEQAYLLNCTTAEVENKKKSFKISADDLAKLLKDGALTQLDVDSDLYNGKVVIEGRDDLSEGTWEITEQGNSHKFYRARLVFPTK